jgi:hypothetical protein
VNEIGCCERNFVVVNPRRILRRKVSALYAIIKKHSVAITWTKRVVAIVVGPSGFSESSSDTALKLNQNRPKIDVYHTKHVLRHR